MNNEYLTFYDDNEHIVLSSLVQVLVIWSSAIQKPCEIQTYVSILKTADTYSEIQCNPQVIRQ